MGIEQAYSSQDGFCEIADDENPETCQDSKVAESDFVTSTPSVPLRKDLHKYLETNLHAQWLAREIDRAIIGSGLTEETFRSTIHRTPTQEMEHAQEMADTPEMADMQAMAQIRQWAHATISQFTIALYETIHCYDFGRGSDHPNAMSYQERFTSLFPRLRPWRNV